MCGEPEGDDWIECTYRSSNVNKPSHVTTTQLNLNFIHTNFHLALKNDKKWVDVNMHDTEKNEQCVPMVAENIIIILFH